MFIYHSDPYIKCQQEMDDNKTLDFIQKYVNLKHSQELEDIFDKHCNSVSYIIEFVSIIKSDEFQLIVPCISRSESSTIVQQDIDLGFKVTRRSDYDYIPFIRFTFSEPQTFNSVRFREIYMLFFNKHSKFEDSLDSTLYYLNRFNKMKVFM